MRKRHQPVCYHNKNTENNEASYLFRKNLFGSSRYVAAIESSWSRNTTETSSYRRVCLIMFFLIVWFLWFQTSKWKHKLEQLEHEESKMLNSDSSGLSPAAVRTRHLRKNSVHNNNKNKKKRPLVPIFDNCRMVDSKESSFTDESYCSYFRPMHFFNEGQPGFEFRDIVTADYPSANFNAWSWQVNNWFSDNNTSILQISETTSFNDVESVTALAIPKTGSRTQRQLFLDYLTPPKKRKQAQRRIGIVTHSHVKEIQSRQNKEVNRYHQGTHFTRKDIVYGVIRDPIERLLSSMAQLLSMRHSRRCVGCDEYLEPCLAANETDEISNEFSVSVVKCLVLSMQEHGYWNEHLVPSAVFLTRPLGAIGINGDIEISMFDVPHLDRILEAFGVREDLHMNQRQEKNTQQESNKLVQNLEDILMDNYASTSDFGSKIIPDLCKLYAVDVSIRRYLGFPNTHC